MAHDRWLTKGKDVFGGILRSAALVREPQLKLNDRGKAEIADLLQWINALQYGVSLDTYKLRALYEILNNAYEGVLDETYHTEMLYPLVYAWLQEGGTLSDSALIEQLWTQFVNDMSAGIVERTVLLPVLGLNIEAVPRIDLGWATFFSNSETSELKSLLQSVDQSTDSPLEAVMSVPCYIKVVVRGQEIFALQQAGRYSTAGLAVLQLFQGSYREDCFAETKRQMAVLGNYRHTSLGIRLSFPGATLQPGSDARIHYNIEEYVNFVLNPKVLSRMKTPYTCA
jgi:hypothetical protein